MFILFINFCIIILNVIELPVGCAHAWLPMCDLPHLIPCFAFQSLSEVGGVTNADWTCSPAHEVHMAYLWGQGDEFGIL